MITTDLIGQTVSLFHRGTRETCAVPIEYVCRTYIAVRWGQSGIYDLNLRDNVLTARSGGARRKGGNQIKWWMASDIEAIRRMVQVHCDGEDRRAAMRRLSAAHEQRKADEWAATEAASGVRAKRL